MPGLFIRSMTPISRRHPRPRVLSIERRWLAWRSVIEKGFGVRGLESNQNQPRQTETDRDRGQLGSLFPSLFGHFLISTGWCEEREREREFFDDLSISTPVVVFVLFIYSRKICFKNLRWFDSFLPFYRAGWTRENFLILRVYPMCDAWNGRQLHEPPSLHTFSLCSLLPIHPHKSIFWFVFV